MTEPCDAADTFADTIVRDPTYKCPAHGEHAAWLQISWNGMLRKDDWESPRMCMKCLVERAIASGVATA